MNIKDIFKLGFKIFLFILIAIFLYFNFALVLFLLLLIVLFLYSVFLYYKLYKAFLLNKPIIRFIFILPLFLWITYFAFICIQELSGANYFVYDLLLNFGVFMMLIDIGAWIIIKFLDQFASISINKELDPNNPKRLKSEIESLINEQIYNENSDIKRIRDILQVSALSIKKQKKIIRTSFITQTSHIDFTYAP